MGHTSLVIKDQAEWDKFLQRLKFEGKTDFSAAVFELIKKDNQYHKEGNPAWPITKWIVNPNSIAVPALDKTEAEIDSFLAKIDEKTSDEIGMYLTRWVKKYNERQDRKL